MTTLVPLVRCGPCPVASWRSCGSDPGVGCLEGPLPPVFLNYGVQDSAYKGLRRLAPITPRRSIMMIRILLLGV